MWKRSAAARSEICTFRRVGRVNPPRKPDLLSGGERERVAIARALAVRSRLLLMDEPLAALDLKRKREILPYLERLHDEQEIPIIYVSHSLDEGARLAGYIVDMEDGRALAQGP